MTGKKVRSTLQTAGKLWIGWALTGTPVTFGSTTPKWVGFTRLRWRMVAYGCGTSQMVGDGHSRDSTPISSDGVIRVGFISKENSAGGSFFIIIPLNLLNREVFTCKPCEDKISCFLADAGMFSW